MLALHLAHALVTTLLVLAMTGCAGEAPTPVSSPPRSGPEAGITAANLYEHEAGWPNQTVVTRELRVGDAVLREGYRGFLIRVEESGEARVDFGRHGKHLVPVDHTDLVLRANEVADGSRTKLGPNFTLLVGTRLLDSGSDKLRALKAPELKDMEAFLCVFADHGDASFEGVADRLRALSERPGLQAIFFPQNADPTATQPVKVALQSNQWTIPFSYPKLSATYTAALIGEAPAAPYVLLVTPNGRKLYGARLDTASDTQVEAIEQALAARFGA